MEDLQDPEADVEADEVGQLERPHRMVETDPGPRVDVLGAADALFECPHRLGQEGHERPVDDEARPVRGRDHLHAEIDRQRPDRMVRLV